MEILSRTSSLRDIVRGGKRGCGVGSSPTAAMERTQDRVAATSREGTLKLEMKMNAFCMTCGKPLVPGTRFCAECGSPTSPGTPATPAPVPSRATVFEKRASTQPNFLGSAIQECKAIGFANLFPYKQWMVDKPWNLLWVRWFVGMALFPLLLVFWVSSTQVAFDSIALLFGVYFALMWAVVLYFMLMPKLALAPIAKVSLFTMVVGISLVLTLQQFPFVSSLYSATTSASIAGRLFGFVLGVGILEEATKALPIWWLYIHKRSSDNLNTIVFLGCVSGFAFGIAEATKYSVSYALGLSYGRLGFGDYLILQLTRLITLPLLHAVWAGIFAYFIALGSINRHVQKGLLLAGLACTAVLHGLYDVFSDSLIGVGIAVLSILIFVAYYRSGEVLQLPDRKV